MKCVRSATVTTGGRKAPAAGGRGERAGDRDVGIVRGVSVSLSWLVVTAEYVGAAVETERAREDEGALITERQRRGTSCAAEIQLSCPNTEV